MTRETFTGKLYDLSVTAGMNQRYHQHEQNRWWWWDTGAKITTAIFAVIGLALAIVSAAVDSPAADAWGVATALIAAVSAVVLNVVPFAAWESKSADCFRRWTDLREEVDALEFDLDEGEPSPQLVSMLKQLEAKTQRLCGTEHLADSGLLERCLIAEEKCRGVVHEQEATAA